MRMKTELVVASNNKGKIFEIHQMLPDMTLVSLDDIGFTKEIPEPHHTFRENALTKARTIYDFCGKNVFADDSGICATALGGLPGVDSAHYSGFRDDEKNLWKLVQELKPFSDKTAWYYAVICLIWEGEVHYFEGRCDGHIIAEKHGQGGFGYDPVFVPDGFVHTFAELPLSIKNQISHRARAVAAMVEFLNGHVSKVAAV